MNASDTLQADTTCQTIFDADLIRSYDRPGPRYTSYPTADRFVEGFDAAAYRRQLEHRALGGVGTALLGSLWRAYFVEREFAADAYAARLGHAAPALFVGKFAREDVHLRAAEIRRLVGRKALRRSDGLY